MLKVLKGLKNPKYKNCFVISAKGYFGDMDEDYNEVEIRKDAESAEKIYLGFVWQEKNCEEERENLPEEYRGLISGASWDDDILPSIDSVEIFYYDELGNPNDVELI